MQRNVVLLSKTIVAQHFKLLTGLRHLCNFKFLSSGQHASHNCRAGRSCSDHGEAVHGSTRHCWLIWRCFTSMKPYLACWMERCLWTARNPVSSHWLPHRTGRCIRSDRRSQDATAPVCSPACDMFIKTQATPLWSARR